MPRARKPTPPAVTSSPDEVLSGLGDLTDEEKAPRRERLLKLLDEAIVNKDPALMRVASMGLAALKKGDSEKGGVTLLMDEKFVDSVAHMAKTMFGVPSQLALHADNLRRR